MSIIRAALDPLQHTLLSGINFSKNSLFSLIEVPIPCGKSLLLGIWDSTIKFHEVSFDFCGFHVSILEPFVNYQKENKDAERKELEKIRIFIHSVLLEYLSILSTSQMNSISGTFYVLAGSPQTSDFKWGENNLRSFKNGRILIRTLHLLGHLDSKPSVLGVWDNFEDKYGSGNKSFIYHLDDRSHRRPEKGCIGFINGMNLPYDHAKWDAKRVSDFYADGNDIHSVYNADNGLIEWAECVVGQAGIPTSPVRKLFEIWQRFFEDCSDEKTNFLQICFSQGVIHVNNALKALPPKLAKRICVLAITPGIYIPSCDSQIIHFMKKSDPISAHLALGRSRIDYDDLDILIINEDDDKAIHPHDPFGPNYINAIRPVVFQFLATNNIK